MIQQHQMGKNSGSLKNVTGNLIRGFFAYLALTPMIFCWGLLLIILFVITLASFEAQTGDATEAVLGVLGELTARFPFLERFALNSPAVSDTGVIEINNNNLSAVIFGLYGWLTLPFVILGLALDLLRGPRPPRAMSGKIKILTLATLAAIAALFINFLLGAEIWSGSALTWSLMFTIGPGIVWFISVVSLSLSHFISSMDIVTPGRPG
jgi:hypothetical protein